MEQEKPQKSKKVLTPEQLEKLKVAREKALEVRRKNAEDKKLIKELANTEKEKVISEVKDKLYKLKVKEKPKIEIEEPDEDLEPEIIIKPRPKKERKKIIIEQTEDEEADNLAEVVYVRKKAEPLPTPTASNLATGNLPTGQQRVPLFQNPYNLMNYPLGKRY